jgi:hypothetical protein
MNKYDVGSPRQLMWANLGHGLRRSTSADRFYYLTSIGLTEDEFWRIAKSITVIEP